MQPQNIKPMYVIAGFTAEKIQEIPELRSIAYLFTHEKSGARLLHLYNDDPNNLFSIAFRTPVSDNTGVPHILEHSVLCGSRKFPLKDPFQELLKGSLQTFLNALTYPDKTMYPVSSQVEADFYNLVDVYCDAVLHPLLTPNTFYQEGWHFHVEEAQGPVTIKGIVYNEMKGVFSDFASHVERKTSGHLFPDTSYSFESGGLPEHITDLTYEQFKAFHSLYYHPSNSFIFLYGNLPSEKTLAFLNDRYLDDFERIEVDSAVSAQPLWSAPRSFSIEAPAPDCDNGFATVALCWAFGKTIDARTSLLGNVLFLYFLGTESAPLKRALIDSRLGEDLDEITHFSTEFVQSMFSVGLRKTRPEHAEKIKKLIFDTLQNEVEKGLDDELLEGALRQVEFRLREITDAGRFPFNLMLAERCMRSWIYEGDALAYLAFEKNLKFLREKKDAGNGWFCDKIRELLIDNNHHLLGTITASSQMGKLLETQTAEQAARLSADFSAQDKKRWHGLTLELLKEQGRVSSPEDLATLPRLHKNDLPPKNELVETQEARISGAPAWLHPVFTSGIAYVDVGFDCSPAPVELLPYVPLYVDLASRCGAAGRSYEEMSKRIALASGGVRGSLLIENGPLPEALAFRYFLHGKALAARVPEMLDIFSDLLLSPDLANAKQIKDILFEMRNELNASVISGGHVFAMEHAASRLVKSKHLSEILEGIAQLRFLDAQLRQFDPERAMEAMKGLHKALIDKNRMVVSITADDPGPVAAAVERLASGLPAPDAANSALPFSPRPGGTVGMHISSSVNFAAKAWKCDGFGAMDIGRYFVLARHLSTNYLWNKIRVEGGAYGGMAVLSSGHPVFTMASYRDPNIAGTLRHFEASLREAAKGLDAESVDQSIIASIGRIDAPRTPHEKGLGETIALLCGRSREFRQQLREAVLQATPAILGKKAGELLDNKNTAATILGSAAAFDEAQKEGMVMSREALL